MPLFTTFYLENMGFYGILINSVSGKTFKKNIDKKCKDY